MAARGDTQLAIGYWLVSHKDTLRKWWAISLLSFIGLSFFWGLVFTIIFFSQSSAVDRQVAGRAAGLSGWTAAALQSPKALTSATVAVIPRDATHVDLLGTLSNANANWGASTVRAHFVVDGKALPGQELFVNQSSNRPVIQLNVEVKASSLSKAQLTVDDTIWTKGNAAALPAANFVVDSAIVAPTTVMVNGQTITTVALKAEVTNRSVYNFRHVVVPVVLTAGSQPVAVDQLTLDTWPTLTSKTIDLSWEYPVTDQVTTTITPQVSRFDSNNVYR